jgi:K+-transporting ATPase A subunit
MKFLHALTLFATVGLALAREFFLKLGIDADYTVIGALGLGLTTLLIFRGLLPIIGVIILCMLVTFSPEWLGSYHLDKDMMLAAALTIILFPWIHKLVKDA